MAAQEPELAIAAGGGHAGSSASDGMSEYDDASDLEQEAAAARDGEGAAGAGGAGAPSPRAGSAVTLVETECTFARAAF